MIERIYHAALDGHDWPLAAMCILADPTSGRWTRELTEPLRMIAFSDEVTPEAADLVTRCAKLLDAMRRAGL
jgi:hypothetical protein